MRSYTLNRNSGIADKRQWKILGGVIASVLILVIGFFAIAKALEKNNSGETLGGDIMVVDSSESPKTPEGDSITPLTEGEPKVLYAVSRVVDGDTIDVMIDGTSQRIRLIGVNTPETVDPNSPQECFGQEASDFMKGLLSGKTVALETDLSQDNMDKYGRLLRYVFLDGENINLKLIAEGYAYEYTYNVPYNYQSEFKAAQKEAEINNRGLWAPNTCNGEKKAISAQSQLQTDQQAGAAQSQTSQQPVVAQPVAAQECTIKGNISNKGERIYHVPGQRYYDATKIDVSKGEQWFCTEQEAVAAGWRRAKV